MASFSEAISCFTSKKILFLLKCTTELISGFDPSTATNEYRIKILSFVGKLIDTGYISTQRTRLCLKPQSRVLQPCHDRWIGSRQPVEAMNIGRSFLDGIHPMWGTVKFIPELLSPHSIQCDIRGNARVGLHYLHSWW